MQTLLPHRRRHENLREGTNDSAASIVAFSLTNAWDILSALEDIPDGLSVGKFTRMDEDVVVHEELTDEAIISSMCAAKDQGATNEEKSSPQDVLEAFDTTRPFLGAHEDNVAMNLFLQCEGRAMRLLQGNVFQSKLTDFQKQILILRIISLYFLHHSCRNRILKNANFFAFSDDFVIAEF